MIQIFLSVFGISLFLNLYIMVFGKRDIEQLKAKIPLKKYLREIDDAMASAMGEMWTIVIKIAFALLSLCLIFWNALLFLVGIVAMMLGTFAAKKCYQIPVVAGLLNRIATYINRLR